MEYTQKYENILKELCRLYKKMLPLIDQVEVYDNALSAAVKAEKPNVRQIHSITSHKDRIVRNLDSISINIAKQHVKLSSIAEFCLDMDQNPLYRYMEKLHLAAYNGIRRINAAEDSNNPYILKRLDTFKKYFEGRA